MTSALFSPYKINGLELANRIVVAPMCQYSASDGMPTDWHVTHLGMLANSGAALVVVEATGVERRGRITHGCTGIYSDASEDAFARIVAQVHMPKHGLGFGSRERAPLTHDRVDHRLACGHGERRVGGDVAREIAGSARVSTCRAT